MNASFTSDDVFTWYFNILKLDSNFYRYGYKLLQTCYSMSFILCNNNTIAKKKLDSTLPPFLISMVATGVLGKIA